MLSEGEFHTSIWEDGVEVWVTQMGSLMNMNTAFVDRANEIVAIIDPFDADKWCSKLEEEGLQPTHLLYTHCLLYTSDAADEEEITSMVDSVSVKGAVTRCMTR